MPDELTADEPTLDDQVGVKTTLTPGHLPIAAAMTVAEQRMLADAEEVGDATLWMPSTKWPSHAGVAMSSPTTAPSKSPVQPARPTPPVVITARQRAAHHAACR